MNRLVTFSDRLFYRMAKLNMRDVDVYSHRIAKQGKGISKGNFTHWKNGGGVSSEKLQLLAKILNTSQDWLLTGAGPEEINDVRELDPSYLTMHTNTVPIIGWDKINEWSSKIMENGSNVKTPHIETTYKGDNCFAVVVESENLHPHFKIGENVIIDTDIKYTNNDFVIIEKDKTHIFRQIVKDGGSYFIKSTNPDWPVKIEALDDTMKVIGVAVEVIRRLR